MERQKIIEAIATAGNDGEYQAAERLLADWMRTYPDDYAMLDMGEMLAMLQDESEKAPLLSPEPLMSNVA